MKRILSIFLISVLYSIASFGAYAQDVELTSEEKKYYNEHPEKLLPDANNAFKESKYLQTQKLCRFHSFVMSDVQVQERNKLWEDAKTCAALVEEMLVLYRAGNISEAQKKALAILNLNIEDKTAKDVLMNGLTTETTSGQDQPITTSNAHSSAHEYVDLGLSVKWATCNIGASSPEEYGDYFAWGETSPKLEYTWSNYKFRTSGNDYTSLKFSKYILSSSFGSRDGISKLEMVDDPARSNWGDGWRVPTENEFQELKDKCRWVWENNGAHSGYRITSTINGKSIFLPAAGAMNGSILSTAGSSSFYWMSNLSKDYGHDAMILYANKSRAVIYVGGRFAGFSVRAVKK